MNKHSEPLFQKSNFSPSGMINFSTIFITPPKTFQFVLIGVAGKEILTLSALSRSSAKRPDYYLLYEYRDFFIDMAGRNNRSKISYSQSATRMMKFH